MVCGVFVVSADGTARKVETADFSDEDSNLSEIDNDSSSTLADHFKVDADHDAGDPENTDTVKQKRSVHFTADTKQKSTHRVLSSARKRPTTNANKSWTFFNSGSSDTGRSGTQNHRAAYRRSRSHHSESVCVEGSERFQDSVDHVEASRNAATSRGKTRTSDFPEQSGTGANTKTRKAGSSTAVVSGGWGGVLFNGKMNGTKRYAAVRRGGRAKAPRVGHDRDV
ncbi:hypothetical protein IAT40_004049 [Kwoniella sp. CBS 6097]